MLPVPIAIQVLFLLVRQTAVDKFGPLRQAVQLQDVFRSRTCLVSWSRIACEEHLRVSNLNYRNPCSLLEWFVSEIPSIMGSHTACLRSFLGQQVVIEKSVCLKAFSTNCIRSKHISNLLNDCFLRNWFLPQFLCILASVELHVESGHTTLSAEKEEVSAFETLNCRSSSNAAIIKPSSASHNRIEH